MSADGDMAIRAGASCVIDGCEPAFVAYCAACKYRSVEHDRVLAAVASCTDHNRLKRHIAGHKGYAHVRVVHHHDATQLGQENQDDRASPTRPVESHRTSSRWAWRQDSCS